MRNVRVTVLPLKSKTAKDIEHDYNLFNGTKRINISFKSTGFANCLDCMTIMLACLIGHCRRNPRNVAFLRQISRYISALT